MADCGSRSSSYSDARLLESSRSSSRTEVPDITPHGPDNQEMTKRAGDNPAQEQHGKIKQRESLLDWDEDVSDSELSRLEQLLADRREQHRENEELRNDTTDLDTRPVRIIGSSLGSAQPRKVGKFQGKDLRDVHSWFYDCHEYMLLCGMGEAPESHMVKFAVYHFGEKMKMAWNRSFRSGHSLPDKWDDLVAWAEEIIEPAFRRGYKAGLRWVNLEQRSDQSCLDFYAEAEEAALGLPARTEEENFVVQVIAKSTPDVRKRIWDANGVIKTKAALRSEMHWIDTLKDYQTTPSSPPDFTTPAEKKKRCKNNNRTTNTNKKRKTKQPRKCRKAAR